MSELALRPSISDSIARAFSTVHATKPYFSSPSSGAAGLRHNQAAAHMEREELIATDVKRALSSIFSSNIESG